MAIERVGEAKAALAAANEMNDIRELHESTPSLLKPLHNSAKQVESGWIGADFPSPRPSLPKERE